MTEHAYPHRKDLTFLEIPTPTPQELKRVWSGIKLGSGCWEWKRCSRGTTGRGVVRLQGKNYLVPRLIYAWTRKQPGNLLVCHHCDNPACCRPDHMFLGTLQENMTDMKIKGRAHRPVGTTHNRKLTIEQVLEIRTSSDTQEHLSARYGVCRSTISHVITRRSWKNA